MKTILLKLLPTLRAHSAPTTGARTFLSAAVSGRLAMSGVRWFTSDTAADRNVRAPNLATVSRSVPALLLACLAFAQACIAADAPKDSGWASLFNGKDLSGWVPVHEAAFAVTNGNLRLVSGMGWLRTEKQYGDFVLEAEWRALVPAYDSGFFIRAGLEGKPWPKDGWQVNLSRTALGALVKGYKTVVPAETPPMPLNQWVKFRIEVRGRKITLDVDGERAWEFNELEADRGYICIQAEDKAFDFRNLRVQELPRSAPPTPK